MEDSQLLQLVKKAKSGDQRALKKIIQQYEPLVHKMARKYSWMSFSHSYDDMLQEGRIAIFKTVNRFQPEKGYQFMTLLFPTVRDAVQGLARKDNKHPKYTASYESLKNKSILEDHSQTYEPAMEIPIEKITEMFDKICKGVDTKRAKILFQKFGLYGMQEMKNVEIGDIHGLSKQAVHSYIVKFTARAKNLYPELRIYV